MKKHAELARSFVPASILFAATFLDATCVVPPDCLVGLLHDSDPAQQAHAPARYLRLDGLSYGHFYCFHDIS